LNPGPVTATKFSPFSFTTLTWSDAALRFTGCGRVQVEMNTNRHAARAAPNRKAAMSLENRKAEVAG
jgi:hypothetical protein